MLSVLISTKKKKVQAWEEYNWDNTKVEDRRRNKSKVEKIEWRGKDQMQEKGKCPKIHQ